MIASSTDGSGSARGAVWVVTGVPYGGESVVDLLLKLLGLLVLEPVEGDVAREVALGSWETTPITRLNEELLQRLGGSWEQPPYLELAWEEEPSLKPFREHASRLLSDLFETESSIAWSDFRMAIVLPFWQQVTRIEGIVHVLRRPAEVVPSLMEEYGLTQEHGAELWLRYFVSAWGTTIRCVSVDYRECVDEPDTVLDRLAAALDLAPASEEIRSATRATVRQADDHGRQLLEAPGPRMRLAAALYDIVTTMPAYAVDSVVAELAVSWERQRALEASDRALGQTKLQLLALQRSHGLEPDASLSAIGRKQERAHRELAILTGAPTADRPTLVRPSSGKLLLLDGPWKREVDSRFVGRSLMALFGEPQRVDEEQLRTFEDGPPVVVYRDEKARYWIVVGRLRYRLRGLPALRDAPTTSLEAIPVATERMSIRPNDRKDFSIGAWSYRWITKYLNAARARTTARHRS